MCSICPDFALKQFHLNENPKDAFVIPKVQIKHLDFVFKKNASTCISVIYDLNISFLNKTFPVISVYVINIIKHNGININLVLNVINIILITVSGILLNSVSLQCVNFCSAQSQPQTFLVAKDTWILKLGD